MRVATNDKCASIAPPCAPLHRCPPTLCQRQRTTPRSSRQCLERGSVRHRTAVASFCVTHPAITDQCPVGGGIHGTSGRPCRATRAAGHRIHHQRRAHLRRCRRRRGQPHRSEQRTRARPTRCKRPPKAVVHFSCDPTGIGPLFEHTPKRGSLGIRRRSRERAATLRPTLPSGSQFGHH